MINMPTKSSKNLARLTKIVTQSDGGKARCFYLVDPDEELGLEPFTHGQFPLYFSIVL